MKEVIYLIVDNNFKWGRRDIGYVNSLQEAIEYVEKLKSDSGDWREHFGYEEIKHV